MQMRLFLRHLNPSIIIHAKYINVTNLMESHSGSYPQLDLTRLSLALLLCYLESAALAQQITTATISTELTRMSDEVTHLCRITISVLPESSELRPHIVIQLLFPFSHERH